MPDPLDDIPEFRLEQWVRIKENARTREAALRASLSIGARPLSQTTLPSCWNTEVSVSQLPHFGWPVIAIPVFAFNIDSQAVAEAVQLHGFVVLETMRTDARRIEVLVRSCLGIDPESEDGPRLIHLSDSVDDRGWIDYLMHSDIFDELFPHRKALLTMAVRAWLSAGQPDYHLARVKLSLTGNAGQGSSIET